MELEGAGENWMFSVAGVIKDANGRSLMVN